jgi:hypothetical protein
MIAAARERDEELAREHRSTARTMHREMEMMGWASSKTEKLQ